MRSKIVLFISFIILSFVGLSQIVNAQERVYISNSNTSSVTSSFDVSTGVLGKVKKTAYCTALGIFSKNKCLVEKVNTATAGSNTSNSTVAPTINNTLSYTEQGNAISSTGNTVGVQRTDPATKVYKIGNGNIQIIEKVYERLVPIAGPKGDTGEKGDQGDQGFSHAPSAFGTYGFSGGANYQGYKGDTGPAGPLGPVGPTGRHVTNIAAQTTATTTGFNYTFNDGTSIFVPGTSTASFENLFASGTNIIVATSGNAGFVSLADKITVLEATTTRLFANNASISNATTSNFFTSAFRALVSFFDSLGFGSATGTNLLVTNATTTNLVSTGTFAFATGTIASATLYNVTLNGTLRDSTGATGTAGQYLVTTGTSTTWKTVSASLATGTIGTAQITDGAGNLVSASKIVYSTSTGITTISGTSTFATTTITSGQATLTDLFATNASITNATSVNLFANNASISNATTTNFFAVVFNALSAFFTGLGWGSATGTSLQLANGTTTNFAATGTFALATGTIASATAAQLNIQNATATNLFASNASFTGATATNLFVNRASISNATTTNFYSENSSVTNATSTTFFAAIFRALTSFFDSLGFGSATGTNLLVTNATTTNLVSTGTFAFATGTIASATAAQLNIQNATATNLFASNASVSNSTTTNLFANNASATNINGVNLFSNNGTITNSTSTNLFSTNASITNATSVNFFANVFNALTAFFTGLGWGSATGTSLQLANGTTTNFAATGTFALATGTIASTSIANANITNAFAQNASATNLFATNASLTNATFTNVSLQGTLRDSTGAVGTSGQYLVTTSTGTIWKTVSASLATGSTGTMQITDGAGNLLSANNVVYSTTTGTLAVSGTSSFATTTISTSSISWLNVLTNLFAAVANIVNLTATNATTTNATNTILYVSTLLSNTGTTSLATTSISNLLVNREIALASNTPATTTNALYNIAGNLYFNGAMLGVAGAGTEWTGGNGTLVRLSTTSNRVVIGASATSTNDNFQVIGSTYVSGTSTLATTTITSGQATLTDLFATRASITNATNTNLFTAIFNALTGFITSLGFGSATGTNLLVTNATTTNLVSTGTFAFATGTIASATLSNANIQNATATNLFATAASFTGATATTLFANKASISDLTVNSLTLPAINVANGTITNATSTNLFAINASITNATATNIFGNNSSITNATSVNLFANNASISNATTTNFFAVVFNALTAFFTGIGWGSATGTSLQLANGTTTNFAATGTFALATGTIASATAVQLNIQNATATNLFATNASLTNATATNLFANNASATNINGVNFFSNNGTITNSTSTNLFSTNASITNATTVNFFTNVFRALTAYFDGIGWGSATGTSLQIANATTTNFAATGTFALATGTIASTSIANANVTNAFLQNATATNLFATNASLTNATATNLFANNASATNINGVNLFSNNGTITNSTSTNLFSTNASITNATTVNFFTNIFRALTAYFDGVGWGSATGTSLQIANATTTNFAATGTFALATGTIASATAVQLNIQNATATNLFASNASISNATATNLFATNASITNATATNIFSVNSSVTNSTATNLFANKASITEATTTWFFAAIFKALSAYFDSLGFGSATGTNLLVTNATTTNLVSTGTFAFATGTIASATIANLNAINEITQNATITNATITKLIATNASFTNATTVNLFANNASITNATSVNLFASKASITEATTTWLFAAVFKALLSYFDSLGFGSATGTNLLVTNATMTNLAATGTFLFATGTISSSTSWFANILNFFADKATITNATVTNALVVTGTSTLATTTVNRLGVGTTTNQYGGELTRGITLGSQVVNGTAIVDTQVFASATHTDNIATRTNALYNVNGMLFFNGYQINNFSSTTVLEYFYGRVGAYSSAPDTAGSAGTNVGVSGPTNMTGITNTTNYYFPLNSGTIQTNMSHTAASNGLVTLLPGKIYRITAGVYGGTAIGIYGIALTNGQWIESAKTNASGNQYPTIIDTTYFATTTQQIRLVSHSNTALNAAAYFKVEQLPVAGTALSAGAANGELQIKGGAGLSSTGNLTWNDTLKALLINSWGIATSSVGGSIYAQYGMTIGTTTPATSTANTLYAINEDLYWSGARFQIATTAPTGTKLDYQYLGRSSGQTIGAGSTVQWTADRSVGNMAVDYVQSTVILAPGRTYELQGDTGGHNSNAIVTYSWYYTTNNGSSWTAIGRQGDSIYQAYNQTGYHVTPATAVFTPTTTTQVAIRVIQGSVDLFGTSPGNSCSNTRCGSWAIVKQLPVVGTALAASPSGATTTGLQGQLQFNFGGVLAAANWLRVSTDTNYRSLVVADNASITVSDFGGSIYSERGITFASTTPGTTTARTLYAQNEDLYWSGARLQIATTAPEGTKLDFQFASGISGSPATTNTNGPFLWTTTNGNMSQTLSTNGRIILAPGRTYELEASLSGTPNSVDGFQFGYASNPTAKIPGTTIGEIITSASYALNQTAKGIFTPTTSTEIVLYRINANSSSGLQGYWNNGNASYMTVKQLPVVGTALAASPSGATTTGLQGQLQFNFGGVLAAANWLRVSTDTNYRSLVVADNASITAADFGGSIYSERGITFASTTLGTSTARTLYAQNDDLYWSGARLQIATSAPSGTLLDYFAVRLSNVGGNPWLWSTTPVGNMSYNAAIGEVLLAPGRTYEIEVSARIDGTNCYLFYYPVVVTGTPFALVTEGKSICGAYTGEGQSNISKALITPTTTTRIKAIMSAGSGTISYGYFVVKQLPVVGTALAASPSGATTTGMQGQLQFNFGGVLAAANWLRVSTDTNYRSLVVADNASITVADFGGSIFAERGMTLGSGTPATTTANTLYSINNELYWSGARFQIATSAPEGTKLDYFYSASPNAIPSSNNFYTWSKTRTNMANTAGTNGRIILAAGRTYELEAFIAPAVNSATDIFSYCWYNSTQGVNIGNMSNNVSNSSNSLEGCGLVNNAFNNASFGVTQLAKTIFTPTTTTEVALKQQFQNGVGWTFTTSMQFYQSHYISIKQLPIVGTALAAGNATTTGVQGQLQFNFAGVMAAVDTIRVSTTTSSLIVGSTTAVGPLNGIYSAGAVSIGATTSSAYMLTVVATTTNIASFTGTAGTGCSLSAAGIIACSSDRTLKENIATYTPELALDKVLKLNPSTFTWKDIPEAGEQLGFIAQEVQEIAPNLVSTSTNGKLQLNTQGMIPLLVGALKEMNKRVFGSFATGDMTITEITASTTIPIDTKINALGISSSQLDAMLEQLASSTAATSTTVEVNENGVISSVTSPTYLGKVIDRMMIAVKDMLATAKEVFIGKVKTNEVCIDDNGKEVCLDLDTLKYIKGQMNGAQGGAQSGAQTGGTNTTTGALTCTLPQVLNAEGNACVDAATSTSTGATSGESSSGTGSTSGNSGAGETSGGTTGSGNAGATTGGSTSGETGGSATGGSTTGGTSSTDSTSSGSTSGSGTSGGGTSGSGSSGTSGTQTP